MTNEEKLTALEAFVSEGDRLVYLGVDLLVDVIGPVDLIYDDEPVIACKYYEPGEGFGNINFFHDNLESLKRENARG